VGDKASFSVLAAGVGALSYQWIKAGADVSGATNANFDIGKVAAADAVSYSVRVQSGGGSTTSSAVGLSVLTAASPIVPGSRFTISGLNLPSTGAAAVAVDGIVLLNPSLSAQAISADVPSTMTVGAIEKSVGVSIGGLGSASFGVGFHNADTANPRWSLTLPELLRVIAFFNTKYTGTDGSVRQTGCYKVETTNLTDGFAVDSSVSAPAAAGQGSLSRYHSADTDKNGAISLSELLRVIAFFNTRYAKTDGTISQTGFYRVQFGTVDGYGTDPARAP
jgi:hypothetical protein